MLPFLEVAHLPSSSSFYSAILQPLGLRYISIPETESPSSSSSPSGGPCITYGLSVPPTPVFQLRQVGNPKPSRIVLTAQSRADVTDFQRYALRANPDIVPRATPNPGGAEPAGTQESRAKVVDFDGNTMEVVYRPPPSDHASRYGGSTVRKTQSTSAEANRILNWNYGVAVSSPASVVRSRVPTPRYAQDDEPYKDLRRAVTTSSVAYDPTASPRQNSSGLSAGTVVGTLLGVAAGAAAGAAITYSMVKNDRARAPQQEFDAPVFTRRSTFPDAHHSTDRSPRYVEVERTVQAARYPHDYAPANTRRSPPEYIARYSQGGSIKGSARELEDLHDDTRSRHSSRHSRTGGSVRTRSEAATARRPLLITETEHRSYVGSSSSKYGNTPPITRSTVQRSHTFDISDRESYASARSQRTHSTIRPSPAPVVPSAASPLVARSRTGSRLTTSTIHMPSQGQVSNAYSLSRAGSYLSARNVPLPASAVGSSHADRDDDDRSVVPDDSISCVGSRRSGRSYHG
ncbi:hypothetical protein CONLIGDRAFT_620774 [Coniochaeta ligniaria NRRL 30616]|uniref:VOC domain-containing protein n=1 Tax=Coniochaeta ligniaria NRRL 30616 TaxID=1408157 RepID=A0A1J7J0D6_9PEZI|nr:hypothetical protein CONLIGDRAFT_620774 [Coniochaeta ligniaria NRRL 30616]